LQRHQLLETSQTEGNIHTILKDLPDPTSPWYLADKIGWSEFHGNRHCVYGWFRGDECLYIGCSSQGLARIFQHNVIGVVEEFKECDEIRIIWVDSSETSLDLESYLLEQHGPRYNKQKGWRTVSEERPLREVMCTVCGEVFYQRFWWQTRCDGAGGRRRCGSRAADLVKAFAPHVSKKEFIEFATTLPDLSQYLKSSVHTTSPVGETSTQGEEQT
jgi:predicted GIY-YIG superfamily endonuclease